MWWMVMWGGLAWAQDAPIEMSAADLIPRRVTAAVSEEVDALTDCTMRVTLDPTGAPTGVAPVRCPEPLIKSATTRLARWRWEPPMHQGEAVSAVTEVTMTFAPMDSEDDPLLPAIIAHPPPKYPAALNGLYVGDIPCVLRVLIGTSGAAVEVEQDECPKPVLERSKQAVAHWQWEPPLYDDHPVELSTGVKVTYKLKSNVERMTTEEFLHMVDTHDDYTTPYAGCHLEVVLRPSSMERATSYGKSCWMVTANRPASIPHAGECTLTVEPGRKQGGRVLFDNACPNHLRPLVRELVKQNRWYNGRRLDMITLNVLFDEDIEPSAADGKDPTVP